MRVKPEPGTRVRFTGDYLRNTGQAIGGEGQSRWVVQACDCGLCGNGRHILTDQPTMMEERIADPDTSEFRHIAFANLQVVR